MASPSPSLTPWQTPLSVDLDLTDLGSLDFSLCEVADSAHQRATCACKWLVTPPPPPPRSFPPLSLDGELETAWLQTLMANYPLFL